MKKVFKKNWQTWAEKHWIKTGCYEEIFQVEKQWIKSGYYEEGFQVELANLSWQVLN